MLAQFIANGIVAGGIYCLFAIGFTLIYRVCGFFNFAQAALYVCGPYLVCALTSWAKWPFGASVLVSLALTSVLGCLMDLSVFRPLRRKGSALVLLIASLGFYIALQNIVSMVFGDDTKSIRPNVSRPGFSVFGARITQAQMVIVLSSIALVGAVAVLLDKTKMGKAMRAVANDPDLASVSGVKSDTVILCVFALGSFLAGIAGILASLDVDMRPTMGIGTLMMGVVAMIIGGAESVHGVALGAMFVGLARHFGVWKIGTQWQDAMAFVILLAFLLLRPQGFLGKKVRKATV